MASAPLHRRRPALSCVECRRRKIKCDRNSPCAHCVLTETECTFRAHRDGPAVTGREQQLPTPSPLTSTPATTAPSPNPGPPRLTTAAQATSEELLDSFQNPNSRGPPGSRLDPPRSGQAGQPELQDILQRLRRLEESPGVSDGPTRWLAEVGHGLNPGQSDLQDSQIILNKTRIPTYYGQSAGDVYEFSTIIACYQEASGDHNFCGGLGVSPQDRDADTGPLHQELGSLLQECKAMARALKEGRPSRCLALSDSCVEMPPLEVTDRMVKLYFGSFESTHRILHVPSFYSEYRRYWDAPETAAAALRLKIILVVGLGFGIASEDEQSEAVREMVYRGIYAAQAWLSGPLEKDRLSLAGIQIHCLTILARQMFSVGGDLVWVSTGTLVHHAMQIGLHRDPRHFPAMTVIQAELRRRLWATILELVVQSSLDAALPPRISLDEFDTDAPLNVDDAALGDSTTPPHARPRAVFTATTTQILLLETIPARLRVLRQLSGLHTDLSYIEVLARSEEITAADRACRAHLAAAPPSAGGPTPFQRNMASYLIRRFLLPLHLPFAARARANPLFAHSADVVRDTATALTTPEPDDDDDGNDNAAFARLLARAGGSFRADFRHAMTVLGLELLGRVEAQRLDGALRRGAADREPLRRAVGALLARAAERLRAGETNVKSHMFLSMVMAQVEAVEAGRPAGVDVARSAVESVRFARRLLQERLGAAAEGMRQPGEEGAFSPGAGRFDGELELDMDFDFFMPDSRLAF